MTRGLSTNRKQVVAYEINGNSYSPQEMFKRITKIIKKFYKIRKKFYSGGFLWKICSISAGKKSKIINCIPHSCLSDKKLF